MLEFLLLSPIIRTSNRSHTWNHGKECTPQMRIGMWLITFVIGSVTTTISSKHGGNRSNRMHQHVWLCASVMNRINWIFLVSLSTTFPIDFLSGMNWKVWSGEEIASMKTIDQKILSSYANYLSWIVINGLLKYTPDV